MNGNSNFKLSHPSATNNIPQMQSAGFQVPFITGANQVASALGYIPVKSLQNPILKLPAQR